MTVQPLIKTNNGAMVGQMSEFSSCICGAFTTNQISN